jgi:hypothetical protein
MKKVTCRNYAFENFCFEDFEAVPAVLLSASEDF